jgi:hypothetical protein
MDFDEDKYIRGIEFKAGNRAIVHHFILYLDTSGLSAAMDGKETEPGYSVKNGGSTGIGVPMKDTIFTMGWAPGNTTHFTPPGTAFLFRKGWKAVLQVHYHTDGKPEEDLSSVALWFEDKDKVEKIIRTGAVVQPYFILKPGENHKEVKATLTLPADLTVYNVSPHMHMLGREMKITATLPDGTVKPMVYVNDWDFNWQETYRYKEPLKLPKGTKVDMVAYFDNSEKNPRQPSHPPKEVTWGEQTTDEMCIGFFGFTVDAEHRNKDSGGKFSLRESDDDRGQDAGSN